MATTVKIPSAWLVKTDINAWISGKGYTISSMSIEGGYMYTITLAETLDASQRTQLKSDIDDEIQPQSSVT